MRSDIESFPCRIGFAIARRLGLDGAAVMVSSRKQHNVDKAVEKLKEDSINVAGMVCHVGKEEDRKQLIQEVNHIAIHIKGWCLRIPLKKHDQRNNISQN